MKKSLFIITALVALLSTSLVAEEFPEWYSEDVQVSEKEITRKNSNNEWVPFIDKTFTACANVKVSESIPSLYNALDAAEKEANEKLDAYLKAHKETVALGNKHELARYKFNDSLADGGAYAQVRVLVSTEKPKAPANNSTADNGIAEMDNLPRILMYNDKRFTLVDTINSSSEESLESHRLALENFNSNGSIKVRDYFYYPNGVLVYDTVFNLGNADIKFNLRNIIKGRRTIIVVRTDCYTDNGEITLNYNNQSFKAKVTKDQKNRWRNIIFEIPEGTITEYTPEFKFGKTSTEQNIGSIFIYQYL